MKYGLLSLGCTTAIAAATLATAGFAQEAETGQTAEEHEAAQPEPFDEAEVLAWEANAYASAYGVSEEEAMRRLVLMHGTPESLAAIANSEGEQLAGLYFENDGEFRVVVRTTAQEARQATRLERKADRRDARREARQEARRAERRDARKAERRAARLAARGVTEAEIDTAETVLSTDQSAPVEYKERAQKSRREARQKICQARRQIAGILGTESFGYGYIEETGAYRVMLTASGEQAQAFEAKRDELVALLGDQVELDISNVPTLPSHTRGGGGMYTLTTSTSHFCTTGFVAYEGSDRTKLGVLTAA